MSVSAIMASLASVPFSRIGKGPKHPTAPESQLAAEIDNYIKRYPFLRENEQFLQFLETYGGGGVFYPLEITPRTTLAIFGVGEFSEAEGLLNSDGYFCFATCIIDYDASRFIETAYFFDATKPRETAVYGRETDMSLPNYGLIHRTHSCFFDWLAAVVATKGFLSLSVEDSNN